MSLVLGLAMIVVPGFVLALPPFRRPLVAVVVEFLALFPVGSPL